MFSRLERRYIANRDRESGYTDLFWAHHKRKSEERNTRYFGPKDNQTYCSPFRIIGTVTIRRGECRRFKKFLLSDICRMHLFSCLGYEKISFGRTKYRVIICSCKFDDTTVEDRFDASGVKSEKYIYQAFDKLSDFCNYVVNDVLEAKFKVYKPDGKTGSSYSLSEH